MSVSSQLPRSYSYNTSNHAYTGVKATETRTRFGPLTKSELIAARLDAESDEYRSPVCTRPALMWAYRSVRCHDTSAYTHDDSVQNQVRQVVGTIECVFLNIPA